MTEDVWLFIFLISPVQDNGVVGFFFCFFLDVSTPTTTTVSCQSVSLNRYFYVELLGDKTPWSPWLKTHWAVPSLDRLPQTNIQSYWHHKFKMFGNSFVLKFSFAFLPVGGHVLRAKAHFSSLVFFFPITVQPLLSVNHLCCKILRNPESHPITVG